MAVDFMIIAGKNPAAELRAINEKHGNFCEVTEGKNGDTLFEAFDVQEWILDEIEPVVCKYAAKSTPGRDDGISYVRKGEQIGHGIVEYGNNMTDGHVCLVLTAVEFAKK